MEKILHRIEDSLYQQVDFKEGIYLADSFVSVPQKLDKGNGEAKLYIGNESEELRDFFGPKPFRVKCFFKKNELLQFMQELKSEYKFPQQQYRRKDELPILFNNRLSKIKEQNEIIWFSLNEQDQIAPPRIYGKSQDAGYKFLRELPLPTLSYLSFIKLESNNEVIFHARLFTDFMPLGSRYHPKEDPNKINAFSDDQTAKINVRRGQAEFRRNVLASCPFCPITKVSDDRLLEAAHIKPYSKSSDQELYSRYNGIAFTPSMHSLYDLGFISIDENSSLVISDWISKVTVRNLGISDKLLLPIPEFEKRKDFFEYHQKNIFRS
jgi:hypothetical protein